MNEFKFSTLRQFGSEQVSFTTVINSDKTVLSTEEIQAQVNQMDLGVQEAFKKIVDREIAEKAILADSADKRVAEVKKLDAALQEEMRAKKDAQKTMEAAEKLSKKLTK